MEKGQSKDDSTTEQAEGDGRASIRESGKNVADDDSVPKGENATDGRKGASGKGTPNVGTGKPGADGKSGRVGVLKLLAATVAQIL